MNEFWMSYGPNVLTVVAILTPLIPAMILKKISDGNIMKTFNNIKELGQTIGLNEQLIDQGIKKIDLVAKSLNTSIVQMETKLDDKIKKIDESVLAFQNGDLYKKMLTGLSQLDELQKLLLVKDDTIKTLGTTIKYIKKKLG